MNLTVRILCALITFCGDTTLPRIPVYLKTPLLGNVTLDTADPALCGYMPVLFRRQLVPAGNKGSYVSCAFSMGPCLRLQCYSYLSTSKWCMSGFFLNGLKNLLIPCISVFHYPRKLKCMARFGKENLGFLPGRSPKITLLLPY